MILRCLIVVLGKEAMQVHPIPCMLITPFAADVARTNPPSRFEYFAAKIAGQRVDSYRAHWILISQVGAAPQLISSETAFWTNNDATHAFADQIFFCSISRVGITEYSFRFEGRVGVLENPTNNNNPQASPNNAPGNEQGEYHAPPPNPQEAEQDANNDVQPNPQEAEEAFNILVAEFDKHGVPHARERATDFEILRFKYAVVDHLLFAQCAGYAVGSFSEVQSIWRDLQVQCAGAYSDTTRAVMEALQAPHLNEPQGARVLEGTLKWLLLLPTFPLRKPPSNTGTKA